MNDATLQPLASDSLTRKPSTVDMEPVLIGMPEIDDEHPFTLEKFDLALIALYDWGIDDVLLQDDEILAVQRNGRLISVGRRPLELETVENLLNEMHKVSASAMLQQGDDHNYTYPVQKDRKTTYRFRVNATASMGMFSNPVGIDITMRAIAQVPPSLDELAVPAELQEALYIRNGIVIIGGATGSGKTTLIGAAIRRALTQQYGQRILAYESPIEFDFRAIPGRTGRIAQSDAYRNLRNYGHAGSNALRRHPDMILLGEARDAETIQSAIHNAETGHGVMTTVHVNSVSETFSRMIGVFPAGERMRALSGLIGSSRVLLYQMLIPTTDGKRCAAREYLILNDDMRDTLYSTPEEHITRVMKDMVKERGRPLIADIQDHFAAGRISEHTFRRYAAEFES